MDNSLMQDLLKFSEQLKERQRYLERCSGMRKSNAELDATLAETVESIVIQLEALITKHLADNDRLFASVYTPYIWRKVDTERLRRKSRKLFENANS